MWEYICFFNDCNPTDYSTTIFEKGSEPGWKFRTPFNNGKNNHTNPHAPMRCPGQSEAASGVVDYVAIDGYHSANKTFTYVNSYGDRWKKDGFDEFTATFGRHIGKCYQLSNARNADVYGNRRFNDRRWNK